MTTQFDESDCLDVNPFEGDFGSPGDRVLKDKIVTARKVRQCSMCLHDIQVQERIRTLTAVFDGQMMSYNWCSKCCAAMAASWIDEGVAWEYRVKLGREIIKQKEQQNAND